jgi:CheY-like chemotaxis protein
MPASNEATADFAAPDLAGKSILIAAAAEIESALLARRLASWGAETRLAANSNSVTALLAERHWDALLIDDRLAQSMTVDGAHRIVLIKPSERHELPALKARGFTGYLVKPVRAASLAARLVADNAFDDGAQPAPAAAADKMRVTGKGLSILVAEDNEINALLARALLTRLGHRPVIAGNGEMAVAAWAAARNAGAAFDLVLMDVQMPGMDGLEAARRIRAAEAQDESGSPRTRMLALTANAQSEDREACLAAGMDGLLVKPLDRERLCEALAMAAAPLAA